MSFITLATLTFAATMRFTPVRHQAERLQAAKDNIAGRLYGAQTLHP